MNKLKVFLLFLILFFFVSCRNVVFEEQPIYSGPENSKCIMEAAPIFFPGGMEFGKVVGLKNCEPFVASAKGFYFQQNGLWGIGLEISTYEDWGSFLAKKEIIYVGGLSLYPGLNKLQNPFTGASLAYYYTYQDLDSFEDSFELDSVYYLNQIFFTSVDQNSEYVSGIYDCRFVIDYPVSGHNPDTILFSDCHFTAKIIE